MKTIHHLLAVLTFSLSIVSAGAQSVLNNGSSDEVVASDKPETISSPSTPAKKNQKYVVITGVRFAYPLVQKWIDDYNKENPDVQIIIESRGTADPAKYDLIVASILFG